MISLMNIDCNYTYSTYVYDLDLCPTSEQPVGYMALAKQVIHLFCFARYFSYILRLLFTTLLDPWLNPSYNAWFEL